MRRIILFVVTNLAVVFVLSVVCRVLGVDSRSTGGLIGFALIFGMGGALISLLMSKPIAKWSTGAHVIREPRNSQEAWLVRTVEQLANQAGVGMPEVAIYEGAPNAFATGAFRNSALVAVSTGLLEQMQPNEVRAVIGHELAHVANGDMVTLTLLQGVLNAVVILLSRVLGQIVDRALSGDDDRRRGPGIGYFVIQMALQLVLGVLASLIVMAFSRKREFAADEGSARYLGSPTDMIAALKRLASGEPGVLPENMKAFGINDKPSWNELFASHPPMEKRIAHLQAFRLG